MKKNIKRMNVYLIVIQNNEFNNIYITLNCKFTKSNVINNIIRKMHSQQKQNYKYTQ